MCCDVFTVEAVVVVGAAGRVLSTVGLGAGPSVLLVATLSGCSTDVGGGWRRRGELEMTVMAVVRCGEVVWIATLESDRVVSDEVDSLDEEKWEE